MASRRNRGPQDKSACRDLSGRRLKAVKQAKELAEYIAKAPGLERKAREEKRRKLEAVLASNPAAGVKMDDHAYWEDKDKLVEGVKNAVKEAVRGARKDGSGRVEIVHTVSVTGGGVKRDLKFAGFEEDYDDSSEEEEEKKEDAQDVEDIDDEEELGDDDDDDDDDEEDEEYEGSTEEEEVQEDSKGKPVESK
jgi:hypothetical protein